MKSKIYWALSAMFLSMYFWVVYQNTVNVPECDDFYLIAFMSDFVQSSSLSEKFGLIFPQHGTHRLLPARIILVIYYWITGTINFSAGIVIANIFLLGVGILFGLYFKHKKELPLFILLMVLLLFNGQNFESSTWAMVGLCNIGALLFMMLSIFLVLRKSKTQFALGLAATAIAIFSNGNAFLLLPVLSLALWLQKERKRMVYFAAITAVLVAYYFLTYGNAIKPDEASYAELFAHAHMLVINFFNFVGNNLWVSASLKIVPFIAGAFICFTYGLAVYKKYYKENMVWFSLFTFMLLTAAAVALNRADSNGMGDARLRIYGSVFTVLTAMFYVENIERLHLQRYVKFIVPATIVFSLFSTLLCYHKVQDRVNHKRVSTYNWQHHQIGLVAIHPLRDSAVYINRMLRAEALKIYAMPQLPLAKLQSKMETENLVWQPQPSTIRYGINYCETQDQHIVIRGWACPENMAMNFTSISVWLLNDSKNIKIHPLFERRSDIYPDRNKKNCGFFAVIPRSEIPQGVYTIGIEIQKRYLVPIKKSAQAIATDVQIQVE
jgi:hypothetical protein